MIELQNVTKTYRRFGGRHKLVSDINFRFVNGRSVAVLGKKDHDRTAFLQLLSGVLVPDQGRIIRTSTISFMMGYDGVFHDYLSGRENIKFVSRLYGRNITEMCDFVADFCEIEDIVLDRPSSSYDSALQRKISWAISVCIHFDFYFVDHVIWMGDNEFQQKCLDIVRQRLAGSNLFLVVDYDYLIEEFCDCAVVLDNGTFSYYDTVSDGLRAYELLG